MIPMRLITMWKFIAENWQILLSIVLTLVGLILTFLGVKKDSAVVRGLKAFINALLKSPESIATAEKISTDPEEKKTYSLKQLELECKAEGVILSDEQRVQASMHIDRQVQLTKEINLDSKNKTEVKPVEVKEVSKISPLGGVNSHEN